jgi:signal transduction histidine kinase
VKVSLTAILLFFFTALVVLESAFVAVLCLDIYDANKIAQAEYGRLALCEDLYSMLQGYEIVIGAMTRARVQRTPQAVAQSLQSQREFLRQVDANTARLLSAQVAPEKVNLLQTDLRNLITTHDAFDRATLAGHPDEAYKVYSHVAANCFRDGARAIKEIHKILNDFTVPKPLLNIDPQNLLRIAAAANALYLLAFAVFVETAISRPITRLAEECEKLKQGLLISKQKLLGSEIGVLQQSFMQMSEQIVQNDQRRKGYIALMQTVQMSILERAQNSFQKLIASPALSEKAKARLQKAGTNVSTLIGLLHSMTDLLGDNEQLKTTIQLKQVGSRQLTKEAAASVEALVQARKIKLIVDEGDYPMLVDPLLIGRVLLNLLSNAIKYSPDGGTVTLSITPDEKNLRFAIQDHGPGITAEGQKKLFQRFSQVAAVDGVQRAGTGLGLVICKEFVEEHGGQIGCDSEPGKGSCFWFSLPSGKTMNKAAKGAVSLDPTGEKSKKSKSIKTAFAVTLILFLAIQIFLFFQLQSKFSASEAKAATYATQKNETLETQEIVVTEAYLGRTMQVATLDRNLGVAQRVVPGMSRLAGRMAELLQKQAPDSQLTPVLAKAYKSQIELVDTLKDALNNIQEVLADPEKFRLRVQPKADGTINLLLQLSDLQSKRFRASFTGSRELSQDLLILLITAAVADLLVLVFGAFTGYKTARRIEVLTEKAQQFSRGQAINVSLVGNDELTLLDSRLCAAANSITASEYQRQELMAIINHDLRTPLSSILGVLESTAQGMYGALPPAEKEIVDFSRDELVILLGQINDLLLLEKIEAGSYEAQKDVLDLDEVISESLAKVAEQATEKNVRLTYNQENHSASKKIRGDKVLLQALVVAVLKNAITASRQNGDVLISAHDYADSVMVSVKNQGNTISADLLPVIFDRFRMVNGKALNGMGLPLAKRIAKLNQGSLSFNTDEPGVTVAEIGFDCKMPPRTRSPK